MALRAVKDAVTGKLQDTMQDAKEKAQETIGMAQQKLESARQTEDEFTKSIERYTSAIPSSAFLGVALGAMALSLMFQMGGRGKWGNFIAQWVPTWLVIGLYNKMVKISGHDRFDSGDTSVSS